MLIFLFDGIEITLTFRATEALPVLVIYGNTPPIFLYYDMDKGIQALLPVLKRTCFVPNLTLWISDHPIIKSVIVCPKINSVLRRIFNHLNHLPSVRISRAYKC